MPKEKIKDQKEYRILSHYRISISGGVYKASFLQRMNSDRDKNVEWEERNYDESKRVRERRTLG